MKTLILAVEDIRTIVERVGLDALIDELITRLTRAIETFDPKVTIVPVRQGFHYFDPRPGLLEWMPILQLGDQATIKIVGYHPANPQVDQLPTILSTVSAYDSATGHLIGLADATFITALRTGVASTVASMAMAKAQSHTVGLVGCGAQAVTQLHALERRFPLETVLIFDTDPAVAASFPKRAAFSTSAIRSASLVEIMAHSDIICTATSVAIGSGPVLPEDAETLSWVHINAVGSDFPGKVEVPLELLNMCVVCPDFRDQAVIEGECQQLAAADIGPDLVSVLQNSDTYAGLREQRTVFDSTGWALEDQVTFRMLIDYANDLGLGVSLQLESMSADPHNPYSFLTGESTVMPFDKLIVDHH